MKKKDREKDINIFHHKCLVGGQKSKNENKVSYIEILFYPCIELFLITYPKKKRLLNHLCKKLSLQFSSDFGRQKNGGPGNK